MPSYRVFAIGQDNQIKGAPRIIECESDEAALEQARELVEEMLLDVWESDSPVG